MSPPRWAAGPASCAFPSDAGPEKQAPTKATAYEQGTPTPRQGKPDGTRARGLGRAQLPPLHPEPGVAQLGLFGADSATLDSDSEDALDERFWRFHRDNPAVYRELCRLARLGRGRGRQRLSIGQLFEVLRWELPVSTNGDEFRLNNSFRSRYARLLEREPELAGSFELRELHTLSALAAS